jgi:hypothetical protein
MEGKRKDKTKKVRSEERYINRNKHAYRNFDNNLMQDM